MHFLKLMFFFILSHYPELDVNCLFQLQMETEIFTEVTIPQQDYKISAGKKKT